MSTTIFTGMKRRFIADQRTVTVVKTDRTFVYFKYDIPLPSDGTLSGTPWQMKIRGFIKYTEPITPCDPDHDWIVRPTRDYRLCRNCGLDQVTVGGSWQDVIGGISR